MHTDRHGHVLLLQGWAAASCWCCCWRHPDVPAAGGGNSCKRNSRVPTTGNCRGGINALLSKPSATFIGCRLHITANQAVANGFSSLLNIACLRCGTALSLTRRLSIGKVIAAQVNTYSWTIQRQSSASGVALTADGYSRKQMGEQCSQRRPSAQGTHHAASMRV